MAFTAAANATQRVGNYAPGSLAAQPRRFAGGVRKRGESPDQMANRMDAGYMASAMQGGTTAPTRADNIAKARADGTFDAKRNAFNAANQGSFMDAAGNIGPKAEMPAPASPTPVNTVTPPTPKLPAGGSPPLMKPVGKIDGRPASLVLESMKSATPSPSLPASQSPPLAVRPPVTPLSPQQEKQFTALGQAHQLSQASQGPMPRVSTTSAMPAKFVAPAGGFSPEFHRQFDPVPTAPQPAVAPATPPAVLPKKKPAGFMAAASMN